MEPDLLCLAAEADYHRPGTDWRTFLDPIVYREDKERVVVYLWSKTLLSEGQCARILAIDRVAFRLLCQTLGAAEKNIQQDRSHDYPTL